MRKPLILTLSSLMTFAFVGCNKIDTEVKARWNYSKEDIANCIKVSNSVRAINDDKTKFEMTIDDKNFGFKETLNEDDLIFFNKSNVSIKEGHKYLTYEDIRNAKVNIHNLVRASDNHGFKFEYDGNVKDTYAVLVNKDAFAFNRFALAEMEHPYNEALGIPDGEWIDQYVQTKANWDTAQDILDIAKYIGDIIWGNSSGCPTAVVDGAFGIASLLLGNLCDTSPTIQDVMNRLQDIDEKLDKIVEMIQKNNEELMDETLYTEAQIDKVIVNLYQQNYADFVTNYLEPLEDIERDYSQYVEAKLKDTVKLENVNVELRYDGYELLTPKDNRYNLATTKIYNINIEKFANAKAFLEANHNTVKLGFVDEVLKDIETYVTKAIENKEVTVDNTLKAEDVKNHVYKVILERYEDDRYRGTYGTDPYIKAQDLLTKAIKLCKHITPIATGESIVKNIVDRIHNIYNFGSEAKPVIKGLLAHMKLVLDKYVLMATEAARFAEINQTEIADIYDKATETIKAYYDINENTPDNYSYITGTELGGDFLFNKYDVQYRNPGNHCEFKAEMITKKVNGFGSEAGKNVLITDDVKLGDYSIVNTISNKKINTRKKMMVNEGLVNNADYLKYLTDSKIIDKNEMNTYKTLVYNEWCTHDAYRILTEYNGIKDVEKADNIPFICSAKGNPDGGYFVVGRTYYYKGSHGDEYWSGKKAAGAFIDGESCKEQSYHHIAAYAKYAEGHGWWIDDEHFAFQDNPVGNYTFVIYNVIG